MAAIDEGNMTMPMMKLENVPVPVFDVDRAKASITGGTHEKANRD
jgi:hypothetical protein